MPLPASVPGKHTVAGLVHIPDVPCQETDAANSPVQALLLLQACPPSPAGSRQHGNSWGPAPLVCPCSEPGVLQVNTTPWFMPVNSTGFLSRRPLETVLRGAGRQHSDLGADSSEMSTWEEGARVGGVVPRSATLSEPLFPCLLCRDEG